MGSIPSTLADNGTAVADDEIIADNRVVIELEFDHDLLFQMFMMAHKRNITFNDLVENILRDAMESGELEKLESAE